jgi:hypothetical protein
VDEITQQEGTGAATGKQADVKKAFAVLVLNFISSVKIIRSAFFQRTDDAICSVCMGEKFFLVVSIVLIISCDRDLKGADYVPKSRFFKGMEDLFLINNQYFSWVEFSFLIQGGCLRGRLAHFAPL